jgi:hypothetical protein
MSSVHPFDRVIMVDWSASSTLGPIRPSPDRCWLAWGDSPARQSPPEYFRGRVSCSSRIESLIQECQGRVLVGLDFPFGYPTVPNMPSGRPLVRLIQSLVQDGPEGTNNRFDVAATLNDRIVGKGAPGPFWGRPVSGTATAIPVRRPKPYPFPEYREVEKLLHSRGMFPQSGWKLMGAGSVGSQALLGLAAVGRLLETCGRRVCLWPFETHKLDDLRSDAVVFAEIWPTIGDHASQNYEIKDARQVGAAVDWAFEKSDELRSAFETTVSRPFAQAQGWILGVE